jgi:hypothetical protein
MLRLVGGRGCVGLLRSDLARGALLLERLGPTLYDVGYLLTDTAEDTRADSGHPVAAGGGFRPAHRTGQSAPARRFRHHSVGGTRRPSPQTARKVDYLRLARPVRHSPHRLDGLVLVGRRLAESHPTVGVVNAKVRFVTGTEVGDRSPRAHPRPYYGKWRTPLRHAPGSRTSSQRQRRYPAAATPVRRHMGIR